jgi:hypothetical protein
MLSVCETLPDLDGEPVGAEKRQVAERLGFSKGDPADAICQCATATRLSPVAESATIMTMKSRPVPEA